MASAITIRTTEEFPLGELGGSRISVLRDQLYIEFNIEKTEVRIHDFVKNQVYDFKQFANKQTGKIFEQYYRTIAAERAIDAFDIQTFIDGFFADGVSSPKMVEDIVLASEFFNEKAEETEERTGRSCKVFFIALLVIGIAVMIIGGVLCACPNLLPTGISLLTIGFLTVTIASIAFSKKNCHNAHSRQI